MTPAGSFGPVRSTGWASAVGIAAIVLGLLFTAGQGTEWMRQYDLAAATPADLALPAARCPPDELEEEGLSVAECEQLVENVRSYLVSMPDWFGATQGWLAALGTLLGLGSLLAGIGLADGRSGAVRLAFGLFVALFVIDAAQFIAAQLAGPMLRALYLPTVLAWSFVHLGLALACRVAAGTAGGAVGHAAERSSGVAAGPDAAVAVVYRRFEVATHWFFAASIFFLFVSSWWMLALPLPSDVFRYREFPFQLHKNLGITVMFLLFALALVRIVRHQALAALDGETALMRGVRVGGHIALYLLILAVCLTGYMSSSYSGWATTWWWSIELPYWGHENDELNELYSDLHLVACWGLLAALIGHIGAAVWHALRNDGVVRRMLRW
jgi:cytochrome b561